jgi:multiple sugar transport system permease protein
MTNIRRHLFLLLLTISIAVAILFPILWGILISFKSRVDALSMPPAWIFTPTLTNYHAAFVEGDALRTLANSLLIATISSCIAIAFALPAAYWLSRTTSQWRRRTLVGAMTTRLAPATVIALPLFLAFARIRLLDTYIPIILVHAAIALAPAMWLLTVTLDRIPTAIDDASFLDGDRTITFFIRQLIPMCWPSFAVTAGFAFVLSWNEFFLTLMLTGYRGRPFTVAVSALMTPHGTNWGQVMAICTVSILPGVILATLGTRYIMALHDWPTEPTR